MPAPYTYIYGAIVRAPPFHCPFFRFKLTYYYNYNYFSGSIPSTRGHDASATGTYTIRAQSFVPLRKILFFCLF
jgi:prepilin signal peptidase PulO-like enzyme (type II secretory pathway)